VKRLGALFVPLFLLLGGALRANADTDLRIGNGDTVAGTLSSASETETFRFRAPNLAILSVAVTGKKAKGAAQAPAVRFHAFFDPDGFEIASSVHVVTASGDRFKNVELNPSGEYRVVVSTSNGVAGDYQLQVKWKTRTPLVYDTGNITAGITNMGFAADAGAVPTFAITFPKGSPVRPWLQKFTDFGTYSQTFVQPPSGTKTLKIKGAALPRTTDYGAFVSDVGGGGGGPYKATITLKLPKPSKRKINITGATIAALANGDSIARGAIVDSTGGRVGGDDTTGTPIEGASVTIPPGALTSPTAIVIGTGRPIPGTGGTSATGPTIVFGPEGTKFKTVVTITIPFDPALVAGGDPSAIQVFTRDAKGHVTKVTAALTVDVAAGTVSFPSSHFSAYRAFGPLRHPPADLDGDGIDDLVVPAPLDAQARGTVYVFRGGPAIAGGKPSDAEFVFIGENGAVGPVGGDLFGAAVATGDLNGDGIADLVVGATRADNGRGKVYVFFGGTGFSSRTAESASAVLTADFDDQRFGGTLVVADVDGDGQPDLVVGAPLSSRFQTSGGAAYVYLGGMGFGAAAAPPPIALAASGPNEQFGTSIAVGDLDHDGKIDIAVGAEQLVSQGTGQVFVFLDAAHSGAEQHALDGTINFSGNATDDRFGASIAIADVDRDGVDHLVVGAPGADDPIDPLKTDVGFVFVFRGASPLVNRTAAGADDIIGAPGVTTAAADGFGESVAVGNVHGGAATDLLVTAPGSDAPGLTDAGTLTLAHGGDEFAINFEIDSGDTGGERRGVLLPPADVNGDGFLDVIVASPHFGSDAGRVRVYLGPGILGRKFDISGATGQALGRRDVRADGSF
jgi:hypothetical protein